MKAHGTVHKYGDNVDTDVIIPARYLNTADHKELASHCMEDIDKDFVKNVKDVPVGHLWQAEQKGPSPSPALPAQRFHTRAV